MPSASERARTAPSWDRMGSGREECGGLDGGGSGGGELERREERGTEEEVMQEVSDSSEAERIKRKMRSEFTSSLFIEKKVFPLPPLLTLSGQSPSSG